MATATATISGGVKIGGLTQATDMIMMMKHVMHFGRRGWSGYHGRAFTLGQAVSFVCHGQFSDRVQEAGEDGVGRLVHIPGSAATVFFFFFENMAICYLFLPVT